MSRPIDRPADRPGGRPDAARRVLDRVHDTLHDTFHDRVRVTPSERTALVRLGALALLAHGLFHGMGVALLWAWSPPGGLSYTDVDPRPGSPLGIVIGVAWLLAGSIFIGAAVLVFAGRRAWRMVAFVGVLVSVPMLLPVTLAVAIPGLIVDAAVLLAVAAHRPPPDADGGANGGADGGVDGGVAA